MSSDWPLKKLSEVANFLNHRRVPLKSLDRDKIQGDFPYYGASGVVDWINDYIFDGNYLLISEDGENLRTRNTPIAFQASGKFWVNNHAHILEEKEEGILDYLEYYFSNLDLSPYITGAVQPKLNKRNLDSIEVPIPPARSRLLINKILNSFTEKIQLNHQINQTLESISQALFKSWFVDFDPVKAKIEVLENGGSEEEALLAAMRVIASKSAEELAVFEVEKPEEYTQLRETAGLFPSAMVESELGEIPEGWEVVAIKDFGEVVCGKTPPKKNADYYGGEIPFIKIPDTHGKIFITETNETLTEAGDQSQPKKRIPKNAVCVSCIATVGQVFITSQPSHTNQQINSIIPKGDNYLYYLLFRMKNMQRYFHDLASGGSTTLNMNTRTFSNIDLLKPNSEILSMFHKSVSSLLERILANQYETSTLANLRDTLLPKLLSGELAISEILETDEKVEA